MKYILIFCAILLTGCSTTVPVKQTFPIAPEILMEQCGTLQVISKKEVLLSEFMTTIVENYTKFHKCSLLVEAWQQWYTAQQQIFEEANKQ